jgi:uncharacterized protein YbcI
MHDPTPPPDPDAPRRPGAAAAPSPMDGALRSAISQAIVRIHAEHYGKGATQAKTYAWDNIVVTVLRDVLTTAERTLVAVDRVDTVRDLRATFQYTMEQTFRSAIERLTGRRVHSFMSQVDPANGLGVEVFVLEPVEGGVPDEGTTAA